LAEQSRAILAEQHALCNLRFLFWLPQVWCSMGGNASQEIGGVRIFKVTPGSPAAEAGLEVFFDFILEVNGAKMDSGYQQSFAQKVQESENGTAKFTVYNSRAHAVREVLVKPRRWEGNGLLGATVRYDIINVDENQGIRVLEIFNNSPAVHAGLVPFQDFLLGTPQTAFHEIDELVEVVTANINQRMQVYVYNVDSETVREVELKPNNSWGGDGCIGCDIGTGLLHRIPMPRRPPGSGLAQISSAGMPPQGAVPPFSGMQAAQAAGLPPPTYPPGAVPPSAGPAVSPAAIATPAFPTAATTPATTLPVQQAQQPWLPGSSGRNIPPVPTAPGGQGASLPGISVGGAWNPALMTAPQPAEPAPPAVPTAPMSVPQGQGVAGVAWPPEPPLVVPQEPVEPLPLGIVTGVAWPPAAQPQAAEALIPPATEAAPGDAQSGAALL